MENLKKTVLYEKHLKLKAKMVPFAGWAMPLQYDKITSEHINVRENAGLFDVSHMGEFFISGTSSEALLQKLVPADISKLTVGKAVYTQLCNHSGGIIDDLIIYRLDDKGNYPHYLLIVNSANIEKDFNWILTNTEDSSKISIRDASNSYSLLALQGPTSYQIISDMGLDVNNQPFNFMIQNAKFLDVDCFISRTGYTGEDGFEILVKNDQAGKLWDFIIDIGQPYGIKPSGLAARDTLRLEACFPLHGNDINDDITPVEAGLGWTVAKDKTDFIGKEFILKQLTHGTDKKFIAFKMLNQSIPRKGCEIFQNGRIIGNTTSGSIAPYLNYSVGLGYISRESAYEPGNKIEVLIRNKKVPAEIVKKPFYRRKRGK